MFCAKQFLNMNKQPFLNSNLKYIDFASEASTGEDNQTHSAPPEQHVLKSFNKRFEDWTEEFLFFLQRSGERKIGERYYEQTQ